MFEDLLFEEMFEELFPEEHFREDHGLKNNGLKEIKKSCRTFSNNTLSKTTSEEHVRKMFEGLPFEEHCLKTFRCIHFCEENS